MAENALLAQAEKASTFQSARAATFELRLTLPASAKAAVLEGMKAAGLERDNGALPQGRIDPSTGKKLWVTVDYVRPVVADLELA